MNLWQYKTATEEAVVRLHEVIANAHAEFQETLRDINMRFRGEEIPEAPDKPNFGPPYGTVEPGVYHSKEFREERSK